MKCEILGLNKKIHDCYVVYITMNGHKYFHGAYKDESKANSVAKKLMGNVKKVEE